MESLSWRRILAALALAGLTTVMGATAWADTQAEGSAGVPAVWTAKELRFVYMGFTSHYSCDGLRDKMRVILTDFGARDDLQVSEGPCADLGRPTRFPGVNIKINVLQPAGDATDSSVVAAHWKRVQLPGPGDAVRQAGLRTRRAGEAEDPAALCHARRPISLHLRAQAALDRRYLAHRRRAGP